MEFERWVGLAILFFPVCLGLLVARKRPWTEGAVVAGVVCAALRVFFALFADIYHPAVIVALAVGSFAWAFAFTALFAWVGRKMTAPTT